MSTRYSTTYWRRDYRFPSRFVLLLDQEGVEETIAEMKENVLEDAIVEFGLVHEGFVRYYMEFADALGKICKSLFGMYPMGAAKFEVTQCEGIKLRFMTGRSYGCEEILSMRIGWNYSAAAEDSVDDIRRTGGSFFKQVMQRTAERLAA